MTTLDRIDFNSDEKRALLATMFPGLPPEELELFIATCNRTQLDPTARQIYVVERKGRWSTQASIDGLRLIAQRSGEYAGQVGPEWCGPDGVWRDVWTFDDFPFAARVSVVRKGFEAPLTAVARFSAYAPYFRSRDGGGMVLGEIWRKMPDTMIAKCAEALALRRAFPQELSGLYTTEEMEQASSIAPPVPDADDLEEKLRASLAPQSAAKDPGPEPEAPAPRKKQRSPIPPVPPRVKAEKPPKAEPATPGTGVTAILNRINSCTDVETMNAILADVQRISDPINATMARNAFKAHRLKMGWLMFTNPLRLVAAPTPEPEEEEGAEATTKRGEK